MVSAGDRDVGLEQKAGDEVEQPHVSDDEVRGNEAAPLIDAPFDLRSLRLPPSDHATPSVLDDPSIIPRHRANARPRVRRVSGGS